MKGNKFLMFLYLFLAIAGFALTWYYNLQFILYSGKTFTVSQLFKDGMSTDLGASITMDLMIAATAGQIWMLVEGYRLKMKNMWFYLVFTFIIAFAFTFPFFLFMRERKLLKEANNENN